MNVVITNVYSPKNLGDLAILKNIEDSILAIYPNATFIYMSKFFKEFDRLDSTCIPNLLLVPENKNVFEQSVKLAYDWIIFWILLAMNKLFGSKAIKNFLKEEHPFRVLSESNLVVAAGGNYIFSSNDSFVSRNMIVHLLHFYCAKVMGKKLILFPQSFGPFYRNYEKRLTARVLRRVDKVITRDRQSKALLEKLGLTPNKVILAPDIAFKSHKPIVKRNLEKTLKVLITALDFSWSLDPEKKKIKEKIASQYVSCLKQLIQWLEEEFDAEVTLFSQVTANDSNDYLISKKIYNELNSERVSLVDMSKESLSNIYDFYDTHHLIVGSRMHSCIFGISRGIPTIGLAYQPKTFGTYDLIGIPDYAYDASELDFELLKQKVGEIIQDYETQSTKFSEIGRNTSNKLQNIIKEVL